MFIFEILFEAVCYIVAELIFYLLLGSIGASVRWLFFQIAGKPRKMKDLKTRPRKRRMGVRKKKKKEQNPQYGYTTGDVFLGGAIVFVVIVIIARFY
jgi:hypothetical protein